MAAFLAYFLLTQFSNVFATIDNLQLKFLFVFKHQFSHLQFRQIALLLFLLQPPLFFFFRLSPLMFFKLFLNGLKAIKYSTFNLAMFKAFLH
jgi:hypothetical protein